jgi:hypothetical protein
MSGQFDPIIERLNDLTKKIDILAMVLASKPNGEQISKLLREKGNKEMSQKKQIRTLKEFDFPNEIIALMIGTTTETVRVTLSQMKSEEKKPRKPKKPEEESKNEQRTA